MDYISKIIDSFIKYEKAFIKNKEDFNKDKNKSFYILNPEWVKELKKYLCYDKINQKIKKNDNQQITELIKALRNKYINNPFPEELKDKKVKINSDVRNYERINIKYYTQCYIIHQKSFRHLFNLLNSNKEKMNFLINRVIFGNNIILIEICNNIFE